MRPPIFLIFFISFIFFASSEVYADDAHSKSIVTTSKARVITPISLVNTGSQGLDFGVIAIGTTTSKVVVSASATVVANVNLGNAMVISSTPQKAAKFTVSGEAEKTYTITLPSSSSILFGANSLTVSNFTCSNGTGGSIGTDDLFYVGGELTIPADATPAVYHGTFNVTVAYN